MDSEAISERNKTFETHCFRPPSRSDAPLCKWD